MLWVQERLWLPTNRIRDYKTTGFLILTITHSDQCRTNNIWPHQINSLELTETIIRDLWWSSILRPTTIRFCHLSVTWVNEIKVAAIKNLWSEEIRRKILWTLLKMFLRFQIPPKARGKIRLSLKSKILL